ncbi:MULTISPECIES: 3-methyl-2-oxobutanoate hydroxymethyltransferase [Mobiluncus]|uniref:3-methyl-2-oxobutanoate hydroxymethyltransferase n=1 Tax=Mobiluncus holmesii ATCC 35242 TaxID=887899 RepID=E6M2C2_9ACTO|nr:MULTISPECIES: 3-methyl-2-oxobutanoate hydroxymethyltransferase [Mobiluncus]EFU82635.1 3-methyl-2-oxobutanoate hydroxymethyltransferase [Mobiluncus holmesii ATCC 35242]MCV0020828.1 3-methyl-2-oxobutanoate hydroxymethyltransferase [Mobiluncus curtisii]NMW44422.1 3-methyl-2-oxobutanoate hydroxymethyltransferase [Mobiluncus curtisii]NMW44767.1 3-methyl-2-oxobutanoate hydroxymethyltransferase [Mobiluncus curtisii]NMW47121.1 3-methyl-2-oxobutanoate hydroxymethyltransferase [Mobiluncus curtisii]
MHKDHPDIGPKPGKPFRVQHVQQYFTAGRPLTMLTAYDAITARIIDSAEIDMILVGDSYGTTMLGMSSTVGVTLDDMVRATAAVAAGASRALVVADMPFGTYESSPAQAVDTAVALVRAGAAAVKLEGGRRILPQVKAIVNAGINVMGHLGFTPQSENHLGGKRLQGRADAAPELIADALALQDAGAFSIVFEMVPAATTRAAVNQLNIPIIGIGAGPDAAGQVLVWTDMAGMQDWKPSFAQVFGQVGAELKHAAQNYRDAVVNRTFPAPENYHEN